MAVKFALRDNEPDQVQILQFLEVAKSRYARSPIVRELTVSLMVGLPNNDILGQINRCVAFVRDNVTFIRDPSSSEYIVSPVRLIQHYNLNGFMAGDCDDHVMLLNSMLGSIGIQSKFVGVKFGGADTFNHVISGVVVNGKIHLTDPCAKSGKQPTYVETLMV